MKTASEILKTERLRQNKTLEQINLETKISLSILQKIENNDFSALKETIVVKGFIQNYAKALKLDPKLLIAVYNRDFREKRKNPALLPEQLDPKDYRPFFWTPITGKIVFISCIGVIFLSYLFFQIRLYYRPPKLIVNNPLNGQSIRDNIIEVKGITDQENSVYINNKLINLNENGEFDYQLVLEDNANQVEIKAVNRKGKETIISREIIR